MKKIRASLWFLFFILLFLVSILCVQRLEEKRKFWHVTQELLQSSYGTDVLSCHFSFTDPEQFQIHAEHLPCYDREAYISSQTETERYLAALSEIDEDKLSRGARETYQILNDYLSQKWKGEEYRYYEEPLSPTSGIHSSLPVLLSEYDMRTRADAESYLGLMSEIPVYFESLARFEADKAQAGMFMASEDADLVISQCDFMASSGGKKLFSDCFHSSLSALGDVSDEDKTIYQKRQQELFDRYVAPAYEKLADQLLLLKEHGKEQKGLCYYEGGKDYYEHRLCQLVGTQKSVCEMETILKKRLDNLYQKLSELKEKGTIDRFLKEKATAGNAVLKKQGLSLLEMTMGESFPRITEQGQIQIKQIPETLLAYTAPAYYFVPRISIVRPGSKDMEKIKNVIYVNPSAWNEPVDLFTTLAHEGYPGHMFQHMYFLDKKGVSKDNVLRYCMDFPGYSEGWAMYVELASYTYAGSCSNLDKDVLTLLRLSREIQLCMLCYLDIQVHYRGASVKEVATPLAQIGIKDAATLHDVYSYLINEPGTYLKYYMGYLELEECKRAYQKCHEIEDADWEKSFHAFFLEHGPDSYINIKKAICQDSSVSSSIMLSR